MIIFCYIALTKNLNNFSSPIDYKSFVDYAYFMILKFAIEVIIDFVAKKFAVYINIIRVVTR